MKVYIHTPREDWIVDRIGHEYARNTSLDVAADPVQADVLWLLSNWTWNQISPDQLRTKPVVCTMHHITKDSLVSARYLENFRLRDNFVDIYHVTNETTFNYLRQITRKPIHKIGYWVDMSYWRSLDQAECRAEFGLDEQDFVIGSFQRDTEGSDLKSPKLAKGPDLLCDFVESLPKNNPQIKPKLLISGYRRNYVKSRMKAAGIPFKYTERLPMGFMVLLYQACDLYVVSSRCEGGPQSILECASSRTPIVSTDVGMARDILPDSCIMPIGRDCPLYMPREEDVDAAFEKVKKFDINNIISDYDSLMAVKA
tara:strand:- start:799 stop:1734 length:936 start_codon:yes stop_codon:yes gene_type:complete